MNELCQLREKNGKSKKKAKIHINSFNFSLSWLAYIFEKCCRQYVKYFLRMCFCLNMERQFN
jgi:hypothetical protein